jgi:hypothetical protein
MDEAVIFTATFPEKRREGSDLLRRGVQCEQP